MAYSSRAFISSSIINPNYEWGNTALYEPYSGSDNFIGFPLGASGSMGPAYLNQLLYRRFGAFKAPWKFGRNPENPLFVYQRNNCVVD